ncbi:hypothetical protein IGI04_022290 [Brassica rapa subsp. trilocularis]|uniref:RING-type domain-containing protein n=1 Tax=Brassica rapa subsp. trilocularis TaxID=1813537 RepID=A0ABQ7M0I5_BRACM|nr:hypothetical protein IGI04_022290 [Brassica rapa subsp. trilocularis]
MCLFINLFRRVRDDESRHPNRYWTKVELDATLVQIISALVVLTLNVARDEYPQMPLLIWFIGYTCGCTVTLPVLYWRIHTFDQDPPETTSLGAVDEEVNIQAVGDEYSRTRIHKVMDVFKVALEFFFIGWFLGYHWFFYDKPSPDDGSLLLSLGFLAFSFIRHACAILPLFYACLLLPVYTSLHSVVGVIRLVIMIIKASCACFSRSSDVDFEKEDVIICCICLGNCGDEKEGKLPCSHVFHFKCIMRWLRIKPTCPLCQTQEKVERFDICSGSQVYDKK